VIGFASFQVNTWNDANENQKFDPEEAALTGSVKPQS
jgi:hypothetical protein